MQCGMRCRIALVENALSQVVQVGSSQPAGSPSQQGDTAWMQEFREVRVQLAGRAGRRWESFMLPQRYTQLEFIGQGSYGCVACSQDVVLGRCVAIKKIRSICNMHEEDVRRVLREVEVLRHLAQHRHDGIVRLISVFRRADQEGCRQGCRHAERNARGDRDDSLPCPHGEVYLVFDKMESDLSHFIRIRRGQLSPLEIQGFTYQCLQALQFVHSAGIIHRDVKPSNILVSADGTLKLADFGLAIDEGAEPEIKSPYVVTRWYRAPELLLGAADYGTAVDMWAVGCVLGELLGGKPLFRGTSTAHQLNLVVQALGAPLAEDLDAMGVPSCAVQPGPGCDAPAAAWGAIFSSHGTLVLELLESLLLYNPEQRKTAAEALRHNYFVDLWSPDAEPACPPFSTAAGVYSLTEVRQLLYDAVPPGQ